MATERYDVVVVGAGGMGSAALYHLARRGIRACAVERFGIAHDRGSSHGDTRLIRKAYMEHPDYVPLLHRAYDLWDELETEGTEELFARVGVLIAGDPATEAMQGQAASYQEHDLPHETLDAAAIVGRYPGLALPAEWSGFYDPLGGFLWVEECVRRHAELAQAHGAVIYQDEVMQSWPGRGHRGGRGDRPSALGSRALGARGRGVGRAGAVSVGRGRAGSTQSVAMVSRDGDGALRTGSLSGVFLC